MRLVHISAIQPPIAPGSIFRTDTTQLLREAQQLVIQAGRQGTDVVCLPELVNTFGMPESEAKLAAHDAPALEATYRELAREYRMYVLLPLLEVRDGHYRNSVHILDRSGDLLGRYDKVHLTDAERDWYGVMAGNTYPVFTADFGRIAVMTCYDFNFPEVAGIYALDGAEIIFFPAWQSGPSEISMEIIMRARAIDNSVYVVRSSFGYEPDVAWRPGMLFGRSCAIAPDGTILCDAGHYVGIAQTRVDLDRPRLMDVLDDGGDVRNLKHLLLHDRRPDTYQRIVEVEER